MLLLPLYSVNGLKGQQQQQRKCKIAYTHPHTLTWKKICGVLQRDWLTAKGKRTPYLISLLYANMSRLSMPPSGGGKKARNHFPRGRCSEVGTVSKLLYFDTLTGLCKWLLLTNWNTKRKRREVKVSGRIGEICWRVMRS